MLPCLTVLLLGNGEAREGNHATPLILLVHEPTIAPIFRLVLPAVMLTDLVPPELTTCS